MKRRRFLVVSGGILLAPWIASCTSESMSHDGMSPSNNCSSELSGTSAYNTLKVPDLLKGTSFDLSMQTGNTSFFEGINTTTYGINGSYLGPALKVRNGEALTLNVSNNLSEESSLHWHGMHVPGNMDGSPHQMIQPGQTWTAQFTVQQKAATHWFHPHTEGETGRQVTMGLAGLMIVEDSDSDRLDLPKTWAVDDFPLILQDRVFQSNGDFDYLSCHQSQMHGMYGDIYLVNGTYNPKVELPNKEVRFRILNASNARVYRLKFNEGRSFKQIATDSAFKEKIVSLNSITLSPGERAEIIVDLTSDSGKQLILQDANNSNKTVVTLQVNQTPANSTRTPDSLITLPQLNPASAVTTRTFVLGMNMGSDMGSGNMGNGMGTFTINGLSMDKSRIDHQIPLGDIEIWEIRNETQMVHNFHTHATYFNILERNGSASNVAEYEKGYKDVVLLNPSESVKVIIQMTDYTTDSTAPYMFHCHILEHEDRGMMGQFTVV